jgi:hypothetical protein
MTTRPKPAHDDGQRRLAVLIDADNAQPVGDRGPAGGGGQVRLASVKRIYGDFTSHAAGQWKKVLLKHSISPVQQFAYTSGKNATDSSLIIDAMDLMYTGRFDGMCLVSSDSDFTRLAQRLREEGLTVYGFGERKTPDAFVQACDKFVYTEVLRAKRRHGHARQAAQKAWRRRWRPRRRGAKSPPGRPPTAAPAAEAGGPNAAAAGS